MDDEPNDLKPDAVVPGVMFLSSEECQESGWILRASNGQFHAVKWCEAAEVSYPRNLAAVVCTNVEEMAAKWDQVAVQQVELRSYGR